MREFFLALVLVALAVGGRCQDARPAPPGKVPACQRARYACFEIDGRPVWAVWDGDHLYLDRNANGDLTERGEALKVQKLADTDPPRRVFMARWGAARLELSCREDKPERLEFRWRDPRGRLMLGGYSRVDGKGCPWGSTPEEAPVLRLGTLAPWTVQPRLEDHFPRDRESTLHLQIGHIGLGQATFTAGDDEYLPSGQYLEATITYKTASGEEKTARWELKERC